MRSCAFERLQVFRTWDKQYYTPLGRRYYDRAITLMLRLLAPPKDSVVLDAGCGPGEHSIRVATAGYRVHAIDISWPALHEAQRRARAANVIDRITFDHGDLTDLQLPDACFETAYCWGVVIHIPEIERALGELVRVLKPGGRLALQVTNHRAWDYALERIARSAFRKPDRKLKRLTYGLGGWCEVHGEPLWVWRVNIETVCSYLRTLGCRKVHHLCAELTELHWRLQGRFCNAVLRANYWWFALGMPAFPGVTNLIVFERPNQAETA